MSEPLTLDQLTAVLAESERRITKTIHDDSEPHFTAIQNDLGKITDRLDRIEHTLWDGERVAFVVTMWYVTAWVFVLILFRGHVFSPSL